MNCKQIDRALNIRFVNAHYRVSNVYFFGGGYGETDFLVVQKSGLIFDIEIKISRSDFFADFKKKIKHDKLSKPQDGTDKPNKFYYAVPKGLVTVNEIPEYAGLLYIDGNHIYEAKPAPILHKNKLEFRNRLADKFYYSYREFLAYKEFDGVGQLKKEISDLKKSLDLANKHKREVYLELRTLERSLKVQT